MHQLMLDEIVAACERRRKDGDFPVDPQPNAEHMEDAILELTAQLAAAESKLAECVGGTKRDLATKLQQQIDKNARLSAKLAECQRDTERLKNLRELCGYAEDGSCQTIRIFQDDATHDWFVTTGLVTKPVYLGSGRSFTYAIDAAIASDKEGRKG